MKLTRDQIVSALASKIPFDSFAVLIAMIKAYQPAIEQMLAGKGTKDYDTEPALDFDHDAICAGLQMKPKDYIKALKDLRKRDFIQRIKVSGVGVCWRINFREIEGGSGAVDA